MHALDVKVMGRTLNMLVNAQSLNGLSQCTVRFANCVLKITGVSDARNRLTTWQILILNGAMIVWINVASVLVAMDILNLTCLHCAMLSDILRIMHFALHVAKLGNVLCVNQNSVLRFAGLLVKICVLNVRNFQRVAVPGDLCVNMHLANALPGCTAEMIYASNKIFLQSMAKIRICRLEPVYNACETTTWSGLLSENTGVTSDAIAKVATVVTNNVMFVQTLIMYSAVVSLHLGTRGIAACHV